MASSIHEKPSPYEPTNPAVIEFADTLIAGVVKINTDGVPAFSDMGLLDSLTNIEAEGGHPVTPLVRAFQLGVRHAIDRLAAQPALVEELRKLPQP